MGISNSVTGKNTDQLASDFSEARNRGKRQIT